MKTLIRFLIFSPLIISKLVLAGDGVKFIENKGQWNKNALFRAELKGGNLYLEKNKLTFDLFDTKTYNRYLKAHHEKSTNRNLDRLSWHAYTVEFLNGNLSPELKGKHKASAYYNYFLGNDKTKWASKAKAYYQVNYEDIYPGISLHIYSADDLKYDIIVEPNANTRTIQLKYNGVDEMYIKKGQLHIKTSVNKIIEEKPYAYQYIDGKKQKVSCNYTLKNNTIAYEFPNGYDKSKKLIIDPTLIFSAYSGSYSNNFGYTATSDSKGFLYSGSSAFGSAYPYTTGAYDTTFNGGDVDIAISKFDTSGSFLVYSTYIGGSSTELPHSLIVNSFDELFILGTTSSDNYPYTTNAYDTTFNGGVPKDLSDGLGIDYVNGSDIIVSHLSNEGDSLLSSTYIGGSNNDGLNSTAAINSPLNVLKYNYADEIRGEIDIDKNNNVYIVSSTQSIADFPIEGNSFQQNYGGGEIDACIIKLDNSLSNIIWSSYLGGEKHDAGYSLSIDSNDDLYVTGGTNSLTFPKTNNIISSNFNGGRADGFITHISKDGQQIINSTYLGSSAYDQSYFIELDRRNNVYVFGQTEITDSTFIKNVVWSEPGSGQFISKITPELDTIVYATVFGSGNGINISPTAFLVDLCGKIYLTGWGGGPNINTDLTNNNASNTIGMNTTVDGQDTTTNGADFYIMVLEDDASNIVYGSYFGGNSSAEHVDGGTSRFDRKGRVYQAMCAGCTGNSDMTIKPSSFDHELDTNNSIGCNLGVFKMDFGLPVVVADFVTPPIGCAPFAYTFNNTSLIQSNTNFFWDFGDGATSSDPNPSHTYTISGTYTITLVLNDNATCNLTDSIQKTIVILGDTSYNIADVAMCLGETEQIGILPTPSPSVTYNWSPSIYLSDSAISNPFTTPDSTTNYSLYISNGVCSDTITQLVQINNPILLLPNDTTLCNNQSVSLSANSFGSSSFFVWSSNNQFTDTLNSDPTDSTIIVSPINSTLYFTIATSNNCSTTDSIAINYAGYDITLFDDTICEGDQIALSLTDLSGQNITHNWTPLSAIVSGADTPDPLVNPSNTTTFIDSTTNSFGCIVIDSLTVVVVPEIVISGGATSTTCDKDTLSIFVNTGDPTAIVWSTNNQFTDTLNANLLDSVLYVDIKATSWYYVLATNGVCSALDSFLVNYIGFDLTVPNGNVCDGEMDTLTVTETPTQILSYSWRPISEILSGANTSSITVKPSMTTVYSVVAENASGCIDSTSSTVFYSGFDPTTMQIFADKDTLINGASTTLHFLPNTGFTYQWTPASSLNNPTIPDPIATPPAPSTTSYTVTLKEDTSACEFQKTITLYAYEIICGEPNVFLPNAFTPNGDKENDILFVRGRTVTKVDLKIYDRWGELVFESDQQAKGWDGSYKGALVDPGVFVYHLEVTCIDGQEYFKKGNVTVIR